MVDEWLFTLEWPSSKTLPKLLTTYEVEAAVSHEIYHY